MGRKRGLEEKEKRKEGAKVEKKHSLAILHGRGKGGTFFGGIDAGIFSANSILNSSSHTDE